MSTKTNEPSSLSRHRGTVNGGPAGFTLRPGQTLCGDLDMRIDRNGVWYYDGSPIGRKALVRLFSRVLRRDEAGQYWLITPAEVGRVEVEDAPFMAVALETSGKGRKRTITLTTNVDDTVTVDADHPLRVDTDPGTGAPSPYVVMDGGVEARLTRAVYYELVALGSPRGAQKGGPHGGQKGGPRAEDTPAFGVWSGGAFFALGDLEGELEDAR